MDIKDAIRILDPATTADALAEIEYYNGFSGRTACVQAVSDACEIAVAVLRAQRAAEKTEPRVACIQPPTEGGLTMPRLIDADELIELLELLAKHEDPFRQSIILGVVDTVRSRPTIDAIPVVRCKECKHWHENTGFCEENSYFVDAAGDCCDPDKSREWTMFDADDFCSKGERKEDYAKTD